MSLPLKYLAKLGMYKVEVPGTPVNVIIHEHEDLVVSGLKELKAKMGGCEVVGLPVTETGKDRSKITLLMLCVETYCLVIKFPKLHYPYVVSLFKEFLGDPKICFVGLDMNNYLSRLRDYSLTPKYRIGTSELVGRVFKMRPTSSEISHLAKMAGLSLGVPPKADLTLIDGWVYTHAEVRFLIHEVHSSFLIGKKLLGSL